jgi:hypothetical protein
MYGLRNDVQVFSKGALCDIEPDRDQLVGTRSQAHVVAPKPIGRAARLSAVPRSTLTSRKRSVEIFSRASKMVTDPSRLFQLHDPYLYRCALSFPATLTKFKLGYPAQLVLATLGSPFPLL